MTSKKEIIVIKLGGALLAAPEPLVPFWDGLKQLQQEASVVIVHGGGPQATAMARRLGHEPRIVRGRRVTGDLDLQIMQWTVRGELNTNLVARAAAHGIQAVGLSGVDGGTVRVTKRPPWQIDGESVDFGHVGDIDRIETDLLERLLSAGFMPVLSPLGVDTQGRVYNVNADTIACAVAAALRASQFLLVTESGGVRRDKDRPDSRLDVCSVATFEQGAREGWIEGGMRVKLEVALDAVRAGIPEVFILAPDDVLERQNGTRVTR